MGEAADMYLDGTLCVQCGVPVPGEAPGHPRYCQRKCELDAARDHEPSDNPKKKVICPECQKRVKEAGLAQHRKDVHGVTA